VSTASDGAGSKAISIRTTGDLERNLESMKPMKAMIARHH
jgi:hypothetical protein